jgi:protoporphyrinogen/coproporphyrinogen III oxidase
VSSSYCVVGGGISGLVAAYRLRIAAGGDATITLFDPADRLGGVLHTVRVGGQPMDVGAEAFVARRPEMPALLAELGMADKQIGTTGVRPLIYSRGRLHPLPPGTVNGVPTSAAALTGLVDDATIARMTAEPARPLTWSPGSDPSLAEVVADRFGEQVVARLVDPMLAGVYAGSAATIGIRSAVPTIAAALDAGAPSLTDAARTALPPSTTASVFSAVDGGYAVLLDELTRRTAPTWVRARIDRLERSGEGWDLFDGKGIRHHADAVVLAVPAPALATLVAGIAPRAALAAQRIPIASSVVVALAVPAGTPLPEHSGVLVASGERLRAKAITLSTRKWGRPGDLELLRLSFGRFGDSLARSAADDELLDWSVADLQAALGATVSPVDAHVQRWIDAMPQYGPGHAELVAQIRAGLPASLAVTGNYLDGIGVPACIAAATRAAASVVAASVAR